ncbi:unnamed protein product [Rotaria socialis]
MVDTKRLLYIITKTGRQKHPDDLLNFFSYSDYVSDKSKKIMTPHTPVLVMIETLYGILKVTSGMRIKYNFLDDNIFDR